MARTPWFKFWSADYIMDADIDNLPLAAQGLLARMWCVCNITGRIPNDIDEIARLTRVKRSDVVLNLPFIQPMNETMGKRFFDSRDGNLYSQRMEKEKAKSELARRSVRARIDRTKQGTSTETASERSSKRSTESPSQRAREPESQNKEQEQASLSKAGTDQTVFEIATTYPKLRHLRIETELKPVIAQAIIAAIESDGAEMVLRGSKAYAATVTPEKREFCPSPEKFFGGFEYRVHSKMPADPFLSMSPAERTLRSIAEFEAQQTAHPQAKAAHS